MSKDCVSHQPAPKPGLQDVMPLVVADMVARAEVGRSKYGTTLQSFNGRDPLIDGFQEALDLTQYLKQAIIERDSISEALTELWGMIQCGRLKAAQEVIEDVLLMMHGSTPKYGRVIH